MSRTPATAALTVVRGATWEYAFTFSGADGAPFDSTGFEARMQVRSKAGMYGTSGEETLLMELVTIGTSPQLRWEAPGSARLRLRVESEDTAVLNPDNDKKTGYAYGLELYLPATPTSAEYVISVLQGSLSAIGEVVR